MGHVEELHASRVGRCIAAGWCTCVHMCDSATCRTCRTEQSAAPAGRRRLAGPPRGRALRCRSSPVVQDILMLQLMHHRALPGSLSFSWGATRRLTRPTSIASHQAVSEPRATMPSSECLSVMLQRRNQGYERGQRVGRSTRGPSSDRELVNAESSISILHGSTASTVHRT